MENSPVVLYALRVSGDVVEPKTASANVARLLGFQASETIAPGWWSNQVHPEDLQNLESSVSEALTRGESRVVYRIRHKDGRYRNVEDAKRLIENLSSTSKELVGSITDITERVLADTKIRLQARELEAERTRLANAQSVARIGSWSFDDETQTLSISDELFRMAGHEPGELETTWDNFFSFFQYEDFGLLLAEEMFVGGESNPPPDHIIRIRRKDDTILYARSRTRGVFAADGTRRRIDGTMADITDRKSAEETLERFFTMSLDMLSISSNGVFKRLNPAFETTLGFSLEELMAEPYLNLVHPDDRAITLETARELDQGRKVTQFVNRYRCRDGSYRWFLWMCAPYGDEIYSVAHDITRIREVEEELRTLNAQLEARVAKRTFDLETANRHLATAKEEADQANRAKSEFLSRMSHELRTPLNAIIGFGQVLETKALQPRDSESVQYILKGGRHLLQLINDILDLARVEAGHTDVSIEAIDLKLVVDECLDLARVLGDKRQIGLRAETTQSESLLVLADHRRLRQVILNLLSNGIKYNSVGGSVEIRTSVTPEMRLRIDVIDSGSGIRPEEMSRLFVPFERVDANKSSIEGTGLGLSLSHRLVELMGGSFKVESVFGVGSTFSVELPQAQRASESSLPTASDQVEAHQDPISNQKQTVLCIEDNPLNIRLFEAIFATRPNITLVTETHGTAGLEIAIRMKPDLVILDVNLPDVSGAEVLKELRRNDELKELPIIVVSADATQRQIANLLAMGADAYLTKPINVAELVRVVDEALVSID